MASQVGSLIQDQNLNVHFTGASAGGKTNVSKAPRKGALSGRKPLGDLSNSVKPMPNQSLKKQNSSIYSFTDKETGASKITFDGGKKKSFNKAPEKQQTSARKALSDISNSRKQQLHEAPKKNLNTKVGIVADEHLDAIAEEGFLHNHDECIKAQTKAMDIDAFLKTVGLNIGFPKNSVSSSQMAPPMFGELKPASPLRDMELEEMADPLFEDRSPWKHEDFSDLDSPPPCRSPKLPNYSMLWKDNEDINFMLIQSP
ncbi:hypothetical protein ACOSP7_027537 [Xanthoceras sorbifolium]|uniref:Uncharacterized protein n=1 Tax=Xanthoceras sorbifolium TaxID=99658 RepID=A0ABQ8HGD8_9ROSI|nr:hypothetical protein JRO89_XS11G0200200 [Xanthoceras sorbifolium]